MTQTADLLAATIAFNTNLRELTQKTTSLLENTLDNTTMNTNFEYFDRIGSVELLVRQGRHSDVQYTPTEFSRRSITCVDYEGMDFIDPQDLQRQMVNTQSAQLANFVKAANRKKDQIIISNLLGASKSVSKDGVLTDVTFDTAWSPPIGVYRIMNRQFDININAFYEEYGCDFFGRFCISKEEEIYDVFDMPSNLDELTELRKIIGSELDDYMSFTWEHLQEDWEQENV
jgi:hypothetical protein